MDATTTQAAPGADTTQASTSAVDNSPWYSSLLSSDGKLNHSAWEKAPDDIKPFGKEASKYGTFEDFLRGEAHKTTLLGKKGLEPLPENAPEPIRKERDELMRRLNGVPTDPKGYGIERPKDLPENLWDNEYASSIAQMAHKHGIPPTAVKEFLAMETKYAQSQMQKHEQMQQEFMKSQDTAVKDFAMKEGVSLEKLTDLASRAGKTYGIPPESPLFKNADVVAALYRMGQAMGEDKLVRGGDDAGQTSDMDRANDIVHNASNPDNKAYMDRNDPRHRAVVDRVNKLYMSAVSKGSR